MKPQRRDERRELIHLANVAPVDAEPIIGFVNELRIESDGWAMLAPLGDYPNTAVVVQADGSLKRFAAIQRLDTQAVGEMVNSFKSSTTKRYLTGIPIYDGHPDMPGMAQRYPDKTQKGVISEVAARADGLWGKPIFTNEGLDLVENRKRTSFSARWTARDCGLENGKPVLRPNVLVSAGLTNNPNLPVRHLMNAEWQQAEPAPTAPRTEIKNQMKKQIIDLLVALGVQMANEATDEQIETGAKTALEKAKAALTLANAKDTAVTELSNEKTTHAQTKKDLEARATELSTVRTELANERKAHIEALLDIAIRDGRITAAQRPEWAGKLAVNFANDGEALKKLTPTIRRPPSLPMPGRARPRWPMPRRRC